MMTTSARFLQPNHDFLGAGLVDLDYLEAQAQGGLV